MMAEDKGESVSRPTGAYRMLQLVFGIVTISALVYGGVVAYGDFGLPRLLWLECLLVVAGTALAFAILLPAARRAHSHCREANTMAVFFSIALFGLADGLPRGLLLLNLAVVVAFVILNRNRLLKRRPALALYMTLALIVFEDILFIWSLVA